MSNETELLKFFEKCALKEEVYETLMALGNRLEKMPKTEKIPSNFVQGCQSNVYLTCTTKNGICYFLADADALISKGLVFCALFIFNGQPAEHILKTNPQFIEALKLNELLSPSRSNGLQAVLLKIKHYALQAYQEANNL
jgi:cysteine desulfuration protein SufE